MSKYSGIGAYLYIMRVDHWFKNVFVLPGTALAMYFAAPALSEALWRTGLAVLATCLLASANYVLNEWLDAESDRHHPKKRNRPGAQGALKPVLVIVEYLLLAGAGLWLGHHLSTAFTYCSLALLFMGLVYNVRPVRSKDVMYLDVLSEAINNPIRLLLGWTAIVADSLPPSSIIVAYWMGGAFLMAVKRYAEYRFIGDPEAAARYRTSFKHYTEERLLLSAFFYASCASFFLAIFLIKYRIEFLLSFPLFAALFTWYLALGMKPVSPAQSPEQLFKERSFLVFTALLILTITALFLVDIPALAILNQRLSY